MADSFANRRQTLTGLPNRQPGVEPMNNSFFLPPNGNRFLPNNQPRYFRPYPFGPTITSFPTEIILPRPSDQLHKRWAPIPQRAPQIPQNTIARAWAPNYTAVPPGLYLVEEEEKKRRRRRRRRPAGWFWWTCCGITACVIAACGIIAFSTALAIEVTKPAEIAAVVATTPPTTQPAPTTTPFPTTTTKLPTTTKSPPTTTLPTTSAALTTSAKKKKVPTATLR